MGYWLNQGHPSRIVFQPSITSSKITAGVRKNCSIYRQGSVLNLEPDGLGSVAQATLERFVRTVEIDSEMRDVLTSTALGLSDKSLYGLLLRATHRAERL
jgi:hypothetical protein